MSLVDHPCYSRRVWRIECGRAVELDIHAPVPTPAGVLAHFAAGLVRQDRAAWAAARVTAIVTRTVPWSTAWLGPRLGVLDADGWSEPWGYAVGSLILLRAEVRPDLLVETTHHECWHVISKRLPAADLAAVDAEVRFGDRWDGDAYVCQPDERRARAYARWATLADEGLRHSVRPGSAAAVFQRVYTGQAGRELHLRDQLAAA